MQKANIEMHVMMKSAQKGLKKVVQNPSPNPDYNPYPNPHTNPKTYPNPIPNDEVKRQLAEHEACAVQRQAAAMARMEKRHARTVQIEVDRERVQWEGALREEGRSRRQLAMQTKHLLEEQKKLREQWEEATKARNALLKDVGRERRQRDVEKQTWLEKRTNLEAALELSNKKEDGRKRKHLTAMAKADELCGQIRQQMGALQKEAGQLKWKRAKHSQLVARQNQAVEIEKWGVKRKETQVARTQEKITKLQQVLQGDEAVLCSKLQKVAALKQVFLALDFLFVCFPLRGRNCRDAAASDICSEDGWGRSIATIVVSTE